MRKVAVQLHDRFGADFFLTGLGDYAAELGPIFQQMQLAIRDGRSQDLDKLSAYFQDLIFALQEVLIIFLFCSGRGVSPQRYTSLIPKHSAVLRILPTL